MMPAPMQWQWMKAEEGLIVIAFALLFLFFAVMASVSASRGGGADLIPAAIFWAAFILIFLFLLLGMPHGAQQG